MSSDDEKSVHLSADSETQDKVLEPTMQRRDDDEDSSSEQYSKKSKPTKSSKGDSSTDMSKPKANPRRKSDTLDVNTTPRSQKIDRNSTTMIVNGTKNSDSDIGSFDSSRYQDTENEPQMTRPPPPNRVQLANTQPIVNNAQTTNQPAKSKGCLLI